MASNNHPNNVSNAIPYSLKIGVVVVKRGVMDKKVQLLQAQLHR